MHVGRSRPRAGLFTTILGVAILGLILGLQGTSDVAGTDPAAQDEASEYEYWFPLAAKRLPSPLLGSKGPQYGVAFMSSAEAPADVQQYENALSTGATWNRWPMYWPAVEEAQGRFDWSAQDATVHADLAHGLRVNAILLGTPGFYRSGMQAADPAQAKERPTGRVSLFAPETATPQGLYEPVFGDGTDRPGSGKTINEANRWARFVFLAVNRYKPGGVLAQQQGWPDGVGVRHWEMWNEPELSSFWDGTLADYARLLKVGYLAAKHADSEANVLFGGLANFARPTYYGDVLAIYEDDPLAASNAYFHDIVATHNYSYAWRSWKYVFEASNTMSAYGLQKPIWLNESGVPAWNDYPGPVWDPNSSHRATLSEQASFVIQSAFYATFAGADVIFHFQLYDGCGNQPAGTDFPPHDGELCDANGRLKSDPEFPCAGDANGLFSNPTDAACFTQHPTPESPRPNYTAFRVLTTHLRDAVPLWRQRPGDDDGNPYTGPQEWIAFYVPDTGQRIIGLWSRVGSEQVAEVPAIAAQATLVTPDGATQTVTPQNGVYRLHLQAATNQNTPTASPDNSDYAIGGSPLILIESGQDPPPAEVAPFLSPQELQGMDTTSWREVRPGPMTVRKNKGAFPAQCVMANENGSSLGLQSCPDWRSVR